MARFRLLVPVVLALLGPGFTLSAAAAQHEEEDASRDIPALARQLTEVQYEALAAIRQRKFEDAVRLLRKLDELAAAILDAPRAASVYRRRATGARAFIERMKERYPEIREALGGTEPPSSAPEPKNQPSVPRPGTVSFVKDIAPLIVRNCLRCHGERNPRSGFSMATYNSMLKGGERGDDIVPGKPDESLLVLLLQGKEEPRMPPNRALRRDLIDLFVKWVAEGAKFDGGERFTPDTPLTELVPSEEEVLREKLAAMSDEELLQYYKDVADRYWKSALPSEEYAVVESRNFLAFTNVDDATVRTLLDAAERTVAAARRAFPHRGKVWRAKLVVFIYKSRYHYAEHTRMVEKRELPYGIYAHFRDAVELPYVACYLPGANELITPEIVVGLGVAEAYFARALPDSPDWLRASLAINVVEKLTRRAEYWGELKDQLAQLAPVTSEQLQLLIEGKLPYDEARMLGYALLAHLDRSGRGAAAVREFVKSVSDPKIRKSLTSDERGKAVLAELAAALTETLQSG